jgi:hypothetical protein
MKTFFKALACSIVLGCMAASFAAGQAIGYGTVFHTNGQIVLGIDSNGTSAAIENSAGFLKVMGSNFSGYKPIYASVYITGQTFTVSGLPACGATYKGGLATVSDASSPTWNATLTGGGSTIATAFCNGTNWVAA